MVKAIARAFRWRKLLENGTHTTIAEIAAAEKINESYVGRVLRLTLLAPDIVEAILGGRQPTEMTPASMRKGACSILAGGGARLRSRHHGSGCPVPSLRDGSRAAVDSLLT